MKYGRYKSEYDYSYTLGMAPTVELIKTAPDRVITVYAHPEYSPRSEPDIAALCARHRLPCEVNRKIFNVLADKENIYIIGVFRKAVGGHNGKICGLPDDEPSSRTDGGPSSRPDVRTESGLDAGAPHVVFVNPGDAGNLGANLRTCVGFGFRDVAVVTPGVDVYNPRTVRASMGAIFHARTAEFPSIDAYIAAYPAHIRYFFMLDGATDLRDIEDAAGCGESGGRFSLFFGNEATGLPEHCAQLGRGVRITHSAAIDSLNLSVAVGIAAYAFTMRG